MPELNVRDDLKLLTKDEIIATLQAQSLPAAVGMWNVHGNLNLGGIIRTANFFGFREVHYFGRRKWDKRGAVGCYSYTPTRHWLDADDFLAATTGYNIVCLENNTNYDCVPIGEFVWPENPLILVGDESNGLPDQILDKAHSVVTIPGIGSIRSLNVTTAASVAMFDYITKAG